MDVDSPELQIELVAELAGHDDRAWNLAWNPARPLLATCSTDKTVRMYSYFSPANSDTPSVSPALKFSHNTTIPTGHTKTVRSVAWSPSGKSLATASFDSNIGVWAQEEDGEEGGGGEWECMSLLEGHETECKSVAYSSTGTLLASCSRDKTVWIWEVHPDSDFECMGVLMEHSQDVKSVAWHPVEEVLASASYDDTIKIYLDDPSDDWFCAATISGHDSTVWSLAWEPAKGRYLASSSDDNTIRIWRIIRAPMSEVRTQCVAVLEGHHRSVYSISWSKGKQGLVTEKEGEESLGLLASTGADGTILIWEILERQEDDKVKVEHRIISRFEAAHGVFDVNSVVWCPREGCEDVFGTAGDDGLVKVWQLVKNRGTIH